MELLTPKVSATFVHGGRRVRFIKRQTLIEKGHPVLKGRTHLVEPVKVDFPLPVAANGKGKKD